MTPEEELAALEELERLEAEEAAANPQDKAKAAELAPILDPSVSLPAQVLSTQPATTHPGGDEAAQSDWVVKGADSAKGSTVVYEPPLAIARKELMENPQLVSALFPDGGITPEYIQMMDESSDIYQAYADHKWDEARWAAADSGQTAYRHGKMPWLQGGEAAGLSPLNMLVTKAKASVGPAIEGANAFILGVDDTAAFGAGRKAGEALDRATGNDTEAVNEGRIEEYPGAHVAGQVAGMFTPGGVLGLLGKGTSALIKGSGQAVAKAGGGAILQGTGKLVGAGAGAVAGGAAMQAGREGVEAAANVGKTGETGTTLSEATGRVQAAALDPANVGLGVGGEFAGMVAGGLARGISNLPRYGGNIERVKQLGGDIKFGQGPVGTKGTDAAVAAGKARDITPQDVMAEQLAPKIAEAENAVASGNFAAAKQAKEDAKIAHGKFKEQYFATKEGKQTLPPVAIMEANLKHLRAKMTDVDGKLRPVGNAEGVATARAELSGDVAQVSLKPVPGAIELSPEEAELFLSPSLTNKLVPKRQPPPAAPEMAPSAPPKGGGPNPQGVNVIKGAEAPTVPPKGKAAKPAGKVEAIPDRDLKPTTMEFAETQVARNEYGNATAPYRDARRADDARASKLDKEFTPAPEAKAAPKVKETANQRLSREYQEHEAAKAAGTAKAPELPADVQKAVDDGRLSDEALQHKQDLKRFNPLAQAIKSTTDKSGLSSVAGVVKAMGGDKAAAHKALLEAERKGAIELRPEGALKGRFSAEEEANMLPGPDKGMKLNPIRVIDEKLLGSILFGAGAAAAGSEEGAAGAAAGGLALALKKKGVSKVYVVPRRYDAQQHEVRIGQLKDLTKDPKMPGAREAKERYAAALKDRSQRSLGGKPGGWSEVQAQTSEKLTKLEETLALAEVEAKKKGAAKRDAPGGTAAKRLVRYSQQRPGELPLKKEIESAGARAGVMPQLNDLRLLDPLQQLRGAMTPRKASPGGKSGILGALADQAALRLVYPGLQGAAGLSRGGLLGTKALQLREDKNEKEAR